MNRVALWACAQRSQAKARSAGADDGLHQRRLAELAACKERCRALEQEAEEGRTAVDELRQAQKGVRVEHGRAQAGAAQAAKTVESCERELRSVEAAATNQHAIFGEHVPAVQVV